MSRRRSRSPSPGRMSRACNSNDPRDLERRIFVGNLPTSDMEKKDLEEIFRPYGKIVGVALLRGFGFVQFERIEEAEAAKEAQKGRIYKGYKIDVNMAVERRNIKTQSNPSPPRRGPYGSYGDDKQPRPRSRSPTYPRSSRDGREPRTSRDRDPREPRPGGHPREHPREHLREHLREQSRDPDFRFRSSNSREKEIRGDPRDPVLSREDYDRYYTRGGAEEYYRRKDEPFREPLRDPWNGRREPEADDRARPEERRRNELYRQYFEELQRRYDTDRPVDCSVIVVNKAQNREYAETVGRKVRDLGMVVDLIFLNTEVSLTQALEDVGRARTPFAIIITQQHQVHRSCTINILFGTPQEHRNMPIQDAMMLIAHNYDTYKVENREKERDEIARKAAKMADDVLLRDPDRESHPISVLTAITLLSENRFLTPDELDSLMTYLKDKRARMVPLSAPAETAPTAAALPPSSHPAHLPASKPSHLSAPAVTNALVNPNHQQELQAKILSLFNSGSGASQPQSYSSMPHSSMPQGHSSMPQGHSSMPQGHSSMPQGHSSMSQGHSSMPQGHSAIPQARPTMTAQPSAATAQGYGAQPGRAPVAPGGQRPPDSSSGINLDNPIVQKALDTLTQSGLSRNHLVGTGASQQPGSRPGPTMGQPTGMPMYPRHY